MVERTRTGDGTLEPIIQVDDDFLDEFALNDCNVHLEAMSDNTFWIGVYKGDREWHIQLGAKSPRAGFYATVWEDAPTSANASPDRSPE